MCRLMEVTMTRAAKVIAKPRIKSSVAAKLKKERKQALKNEEFFDRKMAHTLTVNGNDAGTGIENGKGRIWLRLNPEIVLKWQDNLDIRLVPQKVGRTNRPKRRRKRAAR